MAQSSQAEIENAQRQDKDAQSAIKMRRRQTSFTRLDLRTRSEPTLFPDFVQVSTSKNTCIAPRPFVRAHYAENFLGWKAGTVDLAGLGHPGAVCAGVGERDHRALRQAVPGQSIDRREDSTVICFGDEPALFVRNACE